MSRGPPYSAPEIIRTEQPSTEPYAALPGYLIGTDLTAGAGLGREAFDGVDAGRVAAVAGARGCVTALATIRRGADAVGVRDTPGFRRERRLMGRDGMLGVGRGAGSSTCAPAARANAAFTRKSFLSGRDAPRAALSAVVAHATEASVVGHGLVVEMVENAGVHVVHSTIVLKGITHPTSARVADPRYPKP